jgi:CBS-domain-containing membrane protein
MKDESTPLLDDHLLSLQGVPPIGTDDFFYTRLTARLQKEVLGDGWYFPLKPVLLTSTMVLLLAVNIFMLSQRNNLKEPATATATKAAPANNANLLGFAREYDQVISSY